MYFLPFPEAPWDEENRVLPNNKSYAVSPPSLYQEISITNHYLPFCPASGTLITPYLFYNLQKEKIEVNQARYVCCFVTLSEFEICVLFFS